MSKVELDLNNVLAAEARRSRNHDQSCRFLLEARYEDANEKPCSGMKAYIQRYAPAFNQVAAELGVEGIEVLSVRTVAQRILGPPEPNWDAVALVRYPFSGSPQGDGKFSLLRESRTTPQSRTESLGVHRNLSAGGRVNTSHALPPDIAGGRSLVGGGRMSAEFGAFKT